MASQYPPHAVRGAVNVQHWQDLTFLHWPTNPAHLRGLVPPPLQLDTFDGDAWVGVTPFRMDYFGAPEALFPLVPPFTEINVRTYVRGPDGHDGVWFFSLECSRLPVTAMLRLLGLPYQRSSTAQRRRGGLMQYTSRRAAGGGWFGAEVHVGELIDNPGELENFLTGRWNAYSRAWGQIWRTPIEHEPWPLHTASGRCAARELLDVNSLPALRHHPLIHFAPLVHVRVGPPRPV